MKYLMIDSSTLMPYDTVDANTDHDANVLFDDAKRQSGKDLTLLKVLDDSSIKVDYTERTIFNIVRSHISEGEPERVDDLFDRDDYMYVHIFNKYDIDSIDKEVIIDFINIQFDSHIHADSVETLNDIITQLP